MDPCGLCGQVIEGISFILSQQVSEVCFSILIVLLKNTSSHCSRIRGTAAYPQKNYYEKKYIYLYIDIDILTKGGRRSESGKETL